jgi:hypothetical protein
MALTYQLIQGITGQGNPYTVPASSTVANVTFSNIPSTYTDLVVRVSGRSSAASPEGTYITFNGSQSNFSGTYILGDGSSPSIGNIARYIGSIYGGGSSSNVFNCSYIYISNYSSATTKTFTVSNAAENNATQGYNNIMGGQWANNSIINSVRIESTGFTQNSSFTLYGITRA